MEILCRKRSSAARHTMRPRLVRDGKRVDLADTSAIAAMISESVEGRVPEDAVHQSLPIKTGLSIQ
jgi:hypothetical protein